MENPKDPKEPLDISRWVQMLLVEPFPTPETVAQARGQAKEAEKESDHWKAAPKGAS